MSRFRATLLTALVWTVWHGPRLVDRPGAVVFFAVSVFGLSFLFTWLWSRADHRLFPVVIAHASVNAPMFFWEQTATMSPDRLAGAWMTIQVIYTVLAVTLVMRRRAWWATAERSDRTRSGASDRLR
jgi:membrane protease YdiL (CAAX protease family)